MTSLEDRWAVVGMTGSGKSTWSLKLIEELRDAYPALRTYILDSSHDKQFRALDAIHVDSEQAPDVLRTPGSLQIWHPYVDDIDQYDIWLTRILKHEQPAIVLIDELASLGGDSGRKFPRGYALLNKLGRKHGVMLISCTQEAAYIPRTTLGQATHIVRFRLIDSHDAKKVDKLLRRSEEDWGKDPPDTYGFFHRRTDKQSSGHYYKNYQEFFQ